MKLFWNKHGDSYLWKEKADQSQSSPQPLWKKLRLTGIQRGILLLVGSVLVLTATVFAVYKSVVRPVEIKQPDSTPGEVDGGEEDAFQPPTVKQVQTTVNEDTGEEAEIEVEVPASHKEGVYNILICGTDDDGTRTDTIMIGHLDTTDHSVALLSIPRDTLISGSYSVPKINSVYGGAGKGEAGMEALKKTLAGLLGFEVDGYALVDLDAFVELVDLVGGVDFEVPQNMDYDDPTQDLHIHFIAGMQHLDGQAAMEVVRFRSGYASADIRRTEVQQEFMQVLAQKCLEEISLSKLSSIADIFFENVLTDLTIGNIVYFGQELLKCDFETMYTHTLEGESVDLNGSYYALYLNSTLETVNAYFNPYDAEITAANVNIRTPESVRAANTTTTTTTTTTETTEPEDETSPDPYEPDMPADPALPEETEDPLTPMDPWDVPGLWEEDEYWP